MKLHIAEKWNSNKASLDTVLCALKYIASLFFTMEILSWGFRDITRKHFGSAWIYKEIGVLLENNQ